MKRTLVSSLMAMFMFAIVGINTYAQPTVTFTADASGVIDDMNVIMTIWEQGLEYESEFHAVISDARPCTKIGDFAFSGYEGLLSIQLPTTLNVIGHAAFAGCESLVLTSLPASVTVIDTAAFALCYKLALTSLPAGITVIQPYTFAYTNLENLTLPSGLTHIGDSAFWRCWGLKQITCLRTTPPTLGGGVFEDVPQSACTLIVANCAAVASYKNAAQWKEFFIVPNDLTSNTLSLKTNPANAGTLTGAGTFPLYQFAKFSATANSGYKFVNWTDSATSQTISASQADSIKMYGCPVVLIANFEEVDGDLFNVTLVVEPEDAGTVAGFGNYEEGETATISATANEGFEFVNWTNIAGNIISYENPLEITVVSDTTLVANFAEVAVEYTVTLLASPTAGGNVSGGGTFEKNEPATILATANECYEFINWTNSNGDEISTANPYEFPVVSNLTLTANFDLKQVLAEVVVVGNGKIYDVNDDDGLWDLMSFTTSCGNEIEIAAVADEGYKFSNWTSNNVVISSANPLTVVLLRDTNLVANFVAENVELFEVQITIEPSAGGNVSGAGTYEENEPATLTATANEGFEFVNWSVNGDFLSSENPLIITVTQDTVITANFNFVGIGENTLISGIRISPNPVSSDAIIEINCIEHQPNTVITILDISGREIFAVYTGLLVEGVNTFALPNLPTGNYILLAKNNNGQKAERFVIAR